MIHADRYLQDAAEVLAKLDRGELGTLAAEITALSLGDGRLFIAGMGGSAANASHAAGDFRKLAGIEAYALHDNAAELTARINDDGVASCYAEILRASRACSDDALLVLSVGGGTDAVSVPLVRAIDYAKAVGMRVLGIVGRDGGYTKQRGDTVVLIPAVVGSVTPHTEAFQSMVLHYLVSHPGIQRRATKW